MKWKSFGEAGVIGVIDTTKLNQYKGADLCAS